MDPQLYIEFNVNLDAAKFMQWVGREYCRDAGSVYPQPPDNWDGLEPPWPDDNQPPPEAYTAYYSRAALQPKAGDGAVYILDDEVVRFATQTQTLSDGSTYVFDIAANAKTFEQLSAAGQVAATPTGP